MAEGLKFEKLEFVYVVMDSEEYPDKNREYHVGFIDPGKAADYLLEKVGLEDVDRDDVLAELARVGYVSPDSYTCIIRIPLR